MTRSHNPIFIALVAAICLAVSPAASGQERLAPAFAGSYQLSNIGTPTGVPTPLGGLTFLDANTLLLGGAANSANGAIYAIGVTRDGSNHITAFSGTATLFATAAQIDGGLAFGPGGVLFFTTYPSNTMGEIKPGTSSPDKSVKLTDVGVTGSVGSLQFAPNGDLKVLSYSTGGFYTAVLAAPGSQSKPTAYSLSHGMQLGSGAKNAAAKCSLCHRSGLGVYWEPTWNNWAGSTLASFIWVRPRMVWFLFV